MNYNELLDKVKDLNATVIAALITAIVALLVGVFNSIIGFLNYNNQRKALKIQNSTYELQFNFQKNLILNQKVAALEKELEEFYKPFYSYLSESYLLFRTLRTNLPTGFKTLIYLVDNDYLFDDKDGIPKKAVVDESGMEILKEIFATEDRLKDLIINKGGLVKNRSLNEKYTPSDTITDVFIDFDPNKPDSLPKDINLLGLFMVHCTLIKLAYNKKLYKGNIETYKNFIYPRELNENIKNSIASLNNDITTLREQIK